jgi:hypothetical protein
MNQQEAQPSGTPVSRRKRGETVSIKPSESNEIEQAFNSLETPVKTSGKAAIMRAPKMISVRETYSLQIPQVERQILRLVKARKSSQNEERTEDGNAGTAESTDNQSNNDAGTTHHISTEAKDELHKYFTTKAFKRSRVGKANAYANLTCNFPQFETKKPTILHCNNRQNM